MKKIIYTLIASACAACVSAAVETAANPTPAQIFNVLDKTARWHICNPTNTNLNIRDWEIAPFYDGLIELSKATGNPLYWAEVIRLGDASGWSPSTRKYHGDDHAVCHAWLDTYIADTSKKYRLLPTKKMLDEVIADAKIWGGKKPTRRFGGSPEFLYNWCDALYMSPTVYARLYKITGDKKYLDFMNEQYRKCYDLLFSPEDDLFYRDASYIGQKTSNGKRIFWGRGNGWVMGAFPQIISRLSKADANYEFYVDLFKKMSAKLLAVQLDDGMWGVSLIDPDEFGGGETSSTCFIAYGLAWGVNAGILEKDKYLPALVKAWNRMVEKCVKESGKLVYIQPVGEKPNKFSDETSNPYGVGAFSLFGCELAKILGACDARISDAELVRRAEELNDAATPRAVAIYEPRRCDDAAWENDKIAFRAYGPALREKIENSGIDIWFKHVSYPVLKRLYKNKFEKHSDYHTDNGEGYDNFKVADTVGCGGTGLWIDGKLVKSDVFQKVFVHWTSPERAEFSLYYQYDVGGKKILEKKTISIAVGDNFCEVTSLFRIGRKPLAGIEVATGLFPQTKGAKVVLDTVSKDIVCSEKVDGKTLEMFVRLCKCSELIAFKSVPNARGDERLMVSKTDKDGKIRYIFGFDWK